MAIHSHVHHDHQKGDQVRIGDTATATQYPDIGAGHHVNRGDQDNSNVHDDRHEEDDVDIDQVAPEEEANDEAPAPLEVGRPRPYHRRGSR